MRRGTRRRPADDGVPHGQQVYPDEAVTLRQIHASRDRAWQPDPAADILVLGDSFSNIYSLEAMGGAVGRASSSSSATSSSGRWTGSL